MEGSKELQFRLFAVRLILSLMSLFSEVEPRRLLWAIYFLAYLFFYSYLEAGSRTEPCSLGMGVKRTRSSKESLDESRPTKRRASGDVSVQDESNNNGDEKADQSPRTITNGEPQTPQQDAALRVAASPADSVSSRQSHAVPTVTRNLLGGDLVLSKSNIWTLVHDPVIAHDILRLMLQRY